MEHGMAPKPGDVILVRSAGSKERLARKAQAIAETNLEDPDAVSFNHAAIILNDYLALEAMPAGAGTGEQLGMWDIVGTGEWSGVDLVGGVRYVPIADLVVPALREGGEVVALRAPDAVAGAGVDPLDPIILQLLGSQYSIESLKRIVERKLPALGGVVRKLFHWTSKPGDLSSLLGLEDAQRDWAASLPGVILPARPATYFCSQLVVVVLQQLKLLEESDAETVTPAALHALLLEHGWQDFSAVYTDVGDDDRYLDVSRANVEIGYNSTQGLAQLHLRSQADRLSVDVLAAAIQSMTDKTNDAIDKLRR